MCKAGIFTLCSISTTHVATLHAYTYHFSSALSSSLASPFPFLLTNHHVAAIIATAPTNNPILVA
jgi:hypothetical protein